MVRTHVGKGWWQYCVIVVVVGVCMVCGDGGSGSSERIVCMLYSEG